MNNYISLNDVMKQQKQGIIDSICSDTAETYMIFRAHDGHIEVHTANRVTFDRSLSWDVPTTLECDVELSLLRDEDCIYNCSQLLTEYKQIKEYEDKITKLESKLQEVTKQRNKAWSDRLHIIDQHNNVTHQNLILDAYKRKDWFVLFTDDYSDCSITSIMVLPLSPSDKFFTSDYWTKLFTKDTRWTFANFWEPPIVTFDGYGCNHSFVVCDADSYTHAIHHLLWYPDDKYELILCDEDFMYNRLDEIWKLTYGTDHEGGGND